MIVRSVRGIAAADPEADLERRATDRCASAQQFCAHQNGKQSLGLLQGQQSQRVSNQRRNSHALAAQAIEEEIEDEQTKERL